jgi:hypothetical protein
MSDELDELDELEDVVETSSESSDIPSSVAAIVSPVPVAICRPGELVCKRPNPSKTFSFLGNPVTSLKPSELKSSVDRSLFGGKKQTSRPSRLQVAPEALATGTMAFALTGRSNSELIPRES